MPDHVHLVMGRHPEPAENLVAYLKRAATRQLNREGLHPLRDHRRENGATPSPWVEGGWVRYLNDREAVIDASDYVRRNPLKRGLKKQNWTFVSPFVN